MQDLLTSLLITAVPLVGILVAWPLVSTFFCKQRRQKRATNAAFASLLAVWAAYAAVSQFFDQRSILPYFVVLALFVPLNLYFVLASDALERASAGFKGSAKKPATSESAGVAVRLEPKRAAEPTKQPEIRPAGQPSAKPAGQPAIQAAGQSAARATAQPTTQQAESLTFAQRLQQMTEATKKPSLSEAAAPIGKVPGLQTADAAALSSEFETTASKSAAQPELEFSFGAEYAAEFEASTASGVAPGSEVAPELQPAAESELTFKDRSAAFEAELQEASAEPEAATSEPVEPEVATSEPEPESDLAEITAPIAPAPAEPAEPAAEPEPEPAAAMLRPNFDACYAKAKVFSDKGIWPIAAKLFEEAAAAASSPSQKQKALVAAMSSHMRAGDAETAKKIGKVLAMLRSLTSIQAPN